jgi:hypothetical protein
MCSIPPEPFGVNCKPGSWVVSRYLIQQTTYLDALTQVEGPDGPHDQSPVITKLKASITKYANAMTQFQAEAYGDLPAASENLEPIFCLYLAFR